MLVPVYLLFPFFYLFCEKDEATKDTKVLLSIAVSVGCTVVLSNKNPKIYHHLNQVFSSIIVYEISYYSTDKLDRENYGIKLSMFCLALYGVRFVAPLKQIEVLGNVAWSMLAIPLLLFCACVLRRIKIEKLNRILRWFGNHSLELYLSNIVLIEIVKLVMEESTIKSNGILIYTLIIVIGVLWSYVVKKVEIICKK